MAYKVPANLLDIRRLFNYNTVIVIVYLFMGKDVVGMEKKNILTYAGLKNWKKNFMI